LGARRLARPPLQRSVSVGNGRQPNARLERFVEELVDDEVFPTRGKIAEACGMTDSGFSRAIREEGALSVESCLRLAGEINENPAVVLRIARPADDLWKIVDGMVRRKEFHLNRAEQEHVRLWRQAQPGERQAIDTLLLISARRVRTGTAASPERGAAAILWMRAKRRKKTREATT
jgi:hypothetical protein